MGVRIMSPIPMPPEITVLPVTVEPHGDECGLGYLLRCARANGISMRALLQWVKLSTPSSVPPAAAQALAYSTQVSPSWLGARLPWRRKVEGWGRWRYLGADWSCAMALRGMRPQVCPECLAEGLPCMAVWNLTAAFACLRHRLLLVDRCGRCGRHITWDRPAVDVCVCGRYLSRASESTPVSVPLLAWVGAFCRSAGELTVSTQGEWLAPWLAAFSADGALCVVHALGVCEAANQHVSVGHRPPSWSPGEVAQLVERGLERAKQVEPSQRASVARIRPLVYEQGLERLANQGTTAADRDGAQFLVDRLPAKLRERRASARQPSRKQLDLFGVDVR